MTVLLSPSLPPPGRRERSAMERDGERDQMCGSNCCLQEYLETKTGFRMFKPPFDFYLFTFVF